MSNTSIDFDSAKAILKTYHQVHDTPHNPKRFLKAQLQQTNQELEQELSLLQEKYHALQNELSKRDEKLTKLNRQLTESASDIQRLQEDFENAIYQLTHQKKLGG